MRNRVQNVRLTQAKRLNDIQSNTQGIRVLDIVCKPQSPRRLVVVLAVCTEKQLTLEKQTENIYK